MELTKAVQAHSLMAVKGILAGDPKAVKREGMAALYCAVSGGDMEIAKHMIEYSGVNLRERDEDGNTVLHYAVRSGHEELVRYLVERCGCRPMEMNLEGVTPYDIVHMMQMPALETYFEQVCQAAYEDTYHNPVRRGFFPDPSIVRVNEDYYMVNSSFCYFPCIPVSHSRDLIHWDIIGHAITVPEYSGLEQLEGGRGYWAPDISYCDGRFYITATYRRNENECVRRVQMVTSSQHPEGPYDRPVFIEEDGIDPSLFHDDDGRHYMVLNRGARILELSSDCTRKISDAHLLWYGDYRVNPEGPHLLKKDGWYYLFLAEGGTGRKHQITVARSHSLMGPYESCPHNPIHTQQDAVALIQCSGHGMPVMASDRCWYMVYLCLRIPKNQYGILGRETCLDPMDWTPDGWPIVNGGRGPGGQQRLPLPPAGPRGESLKEWMKSQKDREDGTIDLSDSVWMVPRHGKTASSVDSDGFVVIRGYGTDLCSLSCRSILLRRQDCFCFEVTCTLTSDLSEGDTGLTCYYDENSYMKFGLMKKENRWCVGVWEYVDDSYRTEIIQPLYGDGQPERDCDTAQIALKIVVDYMKRTCLYALAEDDWREAAILEDTSYLSSEGLQKGKRFTGATVGMYASKDAIGRFSSFYYTHSRNNSN